MQPAAVLAVIVKAQGVAPTNAALNSVHKTLQRTDTAAVTAAGNIQKAGARTAAAGRAMSKTGAVINRNVGLPLLAIGALSAKAAIDFEDSFADVKKTVNATGPQFAQLEKGFRKLAKQIPISVNELNRLGGEAGALGIKRKDLLEFVKTAAELGTTTDLSAEEAANALARLSNIMGTSPRDFRRLASTFVDLGNKGASTEAEIANMSLRLAASGKQVGLTEHQVLSFASALSSIGVRAEAGGSAFSKVFAEMQSEVKSNGEHLETYAKVAGMTSEQFAKAFEQDAGMAMIKFLEGLDGIRKHGGNVFGVLKKLELNDIRVRQSLLGAAGAGKLFREQLQVGSKEWKRNVALTNEARKRYGTTASEIELAKNKLYDLGITFGQNLIPVVADAVDILEKVSHFFGMLPDDVQLTILKLAALTVALGIMLSLGGKLVVAYAQIPKLIAWLTTAQTANTAATTAQAAANSELAASTLAAAAAQRELLIANSSGTVVGSVPIGGTAVGKTGASKIAAGLKGALGPALAAIGIGNIVSSVIAGDMKSAGFKAGGALAGGILGFMVGGPFGAMLGVGIGSVVGGALSGLFGSAKKLHPLQERLAAEAKTATQAWNAQKAAIKGLGRAEDRLSDAHKRHKSTASKAREANQSLTRVVEKYGPRSRQAHKAELALAKARRENARAANAEKDAEKLSDNQRKLLLIRSREVVAHEKQRVPALRQVIKQLTERHNKEQNNIQVLKRLVKAETELQGSQKKIKKAISDVNAIAPKQAQRLREMDSIQAKFGMHLRSLVQRYREHRKASTDNTTAAAVGWRGLGTSIDHNTKVGKLDIQSFAEATGKGIGKTKKELYAFAGELGFKNVSFGSKSKPPKKQKGGMVVPGSGVGDKVRMVADVEPGEVVHVLNSRAAKDREKLGHLEMLNQEVPRFQSGGTFVDPAGPGTGVVNRAIADVVGKWSTKYNAAINYGYDPGGGHVSPGHNVTGTATDTGPAAGWEVGTPLFEQGLRAIEGKVDQILYGSHGIGEAYPNHGWGNHAHIEWGMHPDVQGFLAAVVKKKIMTGPEGALKQIGQKELDAAVAMANRKLQQLGGTGGGPDLGDFSGPGKIVGASTYAPDAYTGTVGASGKSLIGKMAFAELGMGTYLGDLPFGSKLKISAGGRSVVGEKLDIGAGGSPVQGHRRDIDLWYETAEALGLPGQPHPGWLGLVEIQKAQRGGIIAEQYLGALQKGSEGKAGTKGKKKKGSPFTKPLHTLAGPHSRKGAGMVRKLNRKLAGMGLDPESPIIQRLASLTTEVEKYDEFANNASALTISRENEETEETETILGEFKGKNEAAWLNEKLRALGGLRKQLISAHGVVGTKTDKVTNLLHDAKKRLRHVRKEIAEGEADKRKIENAIKDLEKARDDKVKQLEKEKKDLEQKLDKAQSAKKPNHDYINQLRDEIKAKNFAINHAGEDARDAVKKKRGHLHDLEERQKGRKRVEGALSGTLIPTLEEKRSDLLQTAVDLYSGGGSIGAHSYAGLQTVQGAGSTTEEISWPPEIGSLGGEVFATQNRLREIGEEAELKQPKNPIESDDELASLNAELATLWKQRYEVSQAQFGVLQNFPSVSAVNAMPFAGGFALGGSVVAKVGERGAEMAVFPQGTRIVSHSDAKEAVSAAGSQGGGPVELNFEELNFYEDGRVEGRINGHPFEKRLNRIGRTPRTPGGKQ